MKKAADVDAPWVRPALRYFVGPIGETTGIRLAIEDVQIVLTDEEFRAVNRIGTRPRGNHRYVLYSDRIGAGAARTVTGRINEQVKRNIQRKKIHLLAIYRCNVCSGI